MYTVIDFRTKKALKEAVAAGDCVEYYSLGMGLDPTPLNGVIYLEGPHYPKPHTWYAEAVVKNGHIVKVE